MPLFALTSMFSFTLRPKYARRMRNAAFSTCRSWSSSPARTVRASPRVSCSPARALSAYASQRLATSSVASSDMRNLPGADRDARESVDVDVVFDQTAQPLARQLAVERRCMAQHRDAGEALDQTCVRRRAVVGRAVEDHPDGLEAELARDANRQGTVVDR